ncbi:MAG: hypothetical protein IJE43_10660 [Alphaproteobacteria bacterium]|nr:hypothetical protein [Alphaproteobacteria bacterium]MBQ3512568.1 hypothetical protein [Lachnospiraceae bacterium]
MTVCDTLVFIKADNLNKIEKLYGKLMIDVLTEVVNRHLSAAFEEIERGALRQKNEMVMAKLDMECPNRKETDFDGES